MLLEGGSVREGAHTPPNVGNILLLVNPVSPSRADRQGIDLKTLDSVNKDYTIYQRPHPFGLS